MPAKELPILPFASEKEWEAWLAQHHANSDGVNIRLYKKASGVKSIDHATALYVALCYGWIDGQSNSLDEVSYLQKFTPRRPKSTWSKRNREHVERLITEGRMQLAGQREIDA